MTELFMKIQNLDVLGKLVKSWSTKKPYFWDAHGKPIIYPEPKNMEEFREILRAAGAGADIPSGIKCLKVVHYNAEDLVLRIPPKKLIEDKEKALKKDGGYPLPAFYLNDPPGADPAATPEQKLEFHAFRIGDYTIAHCN
jgi:hypothetical protein